MANTSGERDIERAKAIRRQKKGVRSPDALRTMEEAAARLEMRGARKLNKVGRRKRRKPLALSVMR